MSPGYQFTLIINHHYFIDLCKAENKKLDFKIHIKIKIISNLFIWILRTILNCLTNKSYSFSTWPNRRIFLLLLELPFLWFYVSKSRFTIVSHALKPTQIQVPTTQEAIKRYISDSAQIVTTHFMLKKSYMTYFYPSLEGRFFE